MYSATLVNKATPPIRNGEFVDRQSGTPGKKVRVEYNFNFCKSIWKLMKGAELSVTRNSKTITCNDNNLGGIRN